MKKGRKWAEFGKNMGKILDAKFFENQVELFRLIFIKKGRKWAEYGQNIGFLIIMSIKSSFLDLFL